MVDLKCEGMVVGGGEDRWYLDVGCSSGLSLFLFSCLSISVQFLPRLIKHSGA